MKNTEAYFAQKRSLNEWCGPPSQNPEHCKGEWRSAGLRVGLPLPVTVQCLRGRRLGRRTGYIVKSWHRNAGEFFSSNIWEPHLWGKPIRLSYLQNRD